jgi:hypothetical protein
MFASVRAGFIECRWSSLLWSAMALIVASVPVAAFAAIELPASKQELAALGREHRTAWDLYKAFEQQADGGEGQDEGDR